MKTKSALAVAILMVLFIGCSDDDKKQGKSISGTWEVVEAAGVEWEENAGNTGAGTIINTNDPDTDLVGQEFIIEGNEITFFGDSYAMEYSNGVLTVDLGDGNTESFNVEFSGSKTMLWTQDPPTAHADYEYNEGGDNYLYYQKSLILEKN